MLPVGGARKEGGNPAPCWATCRAGRGATMAVRVRENNHRHLKPSRGADAGDAQPPAGSLGGPGTSWGILGWSSRATGRDDWVRVSVLAEFPPSFIIASEDL